MPSMSNSRLMTFLRSWWPPSLRRHLYEWQQRAERSAEENARYLGGLEDAARDLRANPVPINTGKALDRIEVALRRDTSGYNRQWNDYRRARDGAPLRSVPGQQQRKPNA